MSISSNPHLPFAFKTNYIGKTNADSDIIEYLYTYTFRTNKKKRYIIEIEQFPNGIYILKFYLKIHKFSKDRYSHLTGDNEAFSILSTCINALYHIKTKIDSNASFGFIGAQKPDEKSEVNTQRFRIYARKCKTIFSTDNYIHTQNISNSSYLILNKELHSKGSVKDIQRMFEKYYFIN